GFRRPAQEARGTGTGEAGGGLRPGGAGGSLGPAVRQGSVDPEKQGEAPRAGLAGARASRAVGTRKDLRREDAVAAGTAPGVQGPAAAGTGGRDQGGADLLQAGRLYDGRIEGAPELGNGCPARSPGGAVAGILPGEVRGDARPVRGVREGDGLCDRLRAGG